MTVFLTTHYMEEAAIADDVVILDSGKIAAAGTPLELKNKYSKDRVYVYSQRSAEADKAFEGYDWTYDNNAYEITVKGAEDAKRLIADCGKYIDDFEVVKGDMDDVFLNVTGKVLTGGER